MDKKPEEKRMKKILSLAILLSLITSTLMPVMAIEDTVLQAGAEQQKVQKEKRAMKYGLIPEVVFLKVSLITTTA